MGLLAVYKLAIGRQSVYDFFVFVGVASVTLLFAVFANLGEISHCI